ncbi:hypothetical protein BDV96DRAFT_359458 [Lophiotrema nucula]|uniref:NAD-dependent epimerase/dehydratase domain-containing protein n=1 Tax=Lophiotrema nucula TaxID=690887 RepID=A0A6A5YH73_9PLEO|nr:hypothetical protein BDV96DRAFT_359458 [Lophiotrema nucula]
MAPNILITGGSGYLGGSLLANLKPANLPSHGCIFAAVRKPEQAEAVKQYNVMPLTLDLDDADGTTKAIIDNEISVIFFLVDAIKSQTQLTMIKALAEVKKKTGNEVHFLHTTGAKMFSSHVGHPTDKPLLDTDPKLYDIQKSHQGPFDIMNTALSTNNIVIDAAEARGVRCYIFAPCIVYGKGEGFGNKISIQTVAIVQAARALQQVYKTDPGNPTWPVCHVYDNTTLYLQILRKILEGEEIGYGKNGYFLASSGSVPWNDLYAAMARALAQHGAVDDEAVKEADEGVLKKMGEALKCSPDFVAVQLAGTCAYTAEHGKRIGWVPKYSAEHILEAASAEVELILKHQAA